MNTVSLGPLSFSTPLLIGMLTLLVILLSSWLADRKLNTKAESTIWKTMFVALFVGRAVFVVSYFDTYLQQPLSMLDLRDGGFSPGAAGLAALLIMGRLAWRHPLSRKPLLFSMTAGLSVLGMAYAALNIFAPPEVVVADVMMSTLDGQPVSISEFRGKPTVINLWATWCPPCRREMPALQDGQSSNPDIHFVFANQGEVAAVVDTYLTQENLSLDNVLLDDNRNLAHDIKSSGLPTTLFLDAQGRLVDIRLGELSSATLQERLNALRSAGAITRSPKD